MTEHVGQGPALEIDQRPRQLLEKYVSLVGTMLMDTGEGLVEFEIPASEQRFWDNQPVARVALLPDALDEEPDAQVLAVGSPLFERLLTAIRARGYRESRGLIVPTEGPSPAAVVFPIAVEHASVEPAGTELMLLPVGRLLARVSIRAGTCIEERLVETPAVDFSSGALLPLELVASLDAPTAAQSAGMAAAYPAKPAKSRSVEELLPLLFAVLEKELAPELARAREEATRGLGAEVQRLDRYYQAMLDDVEPEDDDPDGAHHRKVAIEAERNRRKEEEEERGRLRVTVHPLQITEWQVLAQRATWRLVTPTGREARLGATRMLTGATSWRLACPSCNAEPLAIRVCCEGHAACHACSDVCGVCGESACASHGLTTCSAEGHPVCAVDARTCGSCGTAHCASHSGHCRPGDHEVCPSCAIRCERCGLDVCKAHATRTGAYAPRGARWLCAGCMVYCEGGNNEPVGIDEAVKCSSCDRHICEGHRVDCAVDGQAHCSRHLRRSDRSGRLSCEQHRAVCADEPGSSMASDEIHACAECSRAVCDVHGGRCQADNAVHCVAHLAALADQPNAKACAKHRTICHVDGVTYSLGGTQPCPVCGKSACHSHRLACGSCVRQVCVRDMEEGRCVTCRALADTPDPSDDMLHAALEANGGQPVKNSGWRSARDASHTVVELSLGWTRRLVFTVAHGDTKPRTVVRHSIFGTSRKR